MQLTKVNIAILLCLVTILTSCTGRDGGFDPTKPYSLDLTPPEGPYEYEEGWSDGCESGISVYHNNFMKFMGTHEFRQNPKLRKNKMYYRAWKDSFLYCSLYMETTTRSKL